MTIRCGGKKRVEGGKKEKKKPRRGASTRHEQKQARLGGHKKVGTTFSHGNLNKTKTPPTRAGEQDQEEGQEKIIRKKNHDPHKNFEPRFRRNDLAD